MDGQRGKDGRATRCDVERHGHAGDADRDLAVGRRGRLDVDRTRAVDIVGKDGLRVCSEQLSGDEDACDDGAVLLLHGGVGDDALVARLSKISSASPRAEATGVVLYLRRERKVAR